MTKPAEVHQVTRNSENPLEYNHDPPGNLSFFDKMLEKLDASIIDVVSPSHQAPSCNNSLKSNNLDRMATADTLIDSTLVQLPEKQKINIDISSSQISAPSSDRDSIDSVSESSIGHIGKFTPLPKLRHLMHDDSLYSIIDLEQGGDKPSDAMNLFHLQRPVSAIVDGTL